VLVAANFDNEPRKVSRSSLSQKLELSQPPITVAAAIDFSIFSSAPPFIFKCFILANTKLIATASAVLT
jgi:hypothetical protein